MPSASVRLACLALVTWCGSAAAEGLPAPIEAPGRKVLLAVRAEGAQIYECSSESAGGAMSWRLREPIATLISDGKTIGRHFVGPAWEVASGGSIRGKVAASVPGASAADLPWLRLDVIGRSGGGQLADATAVQRIDTKGGVVSGGCDRLGAFRVEPYSATYVFLR